MKQIIVPEYLVDVPVVAADFLVDSGIFDRLLAVVRTATAGVPGKLRLWLGSDLRDPSNSLPPFVEPTEPGPWDGVILIECDEPTYWLLVRAGDQKQRPAVAPKPTAGSRPYWADPPLASRDRAERRDRMNWPDQEEPWNSPPVDGELWRK